VEEITRGAGRALIRIVVTGSESTGKSALAAALAAHYGAELVPEFVRDYAESKREPLSFADHGPIARGQMALEDRHAEAAARGRGVLVQDTDLLSTAVYCDHYFGACPQWIADLAVERRPDLYLLPEIDVPWIADGIRDRGERREEMHELFLDAVVASGAQYVVIEGSWKERWQRAVESVDALLARRSGR